MKEAIDNTSDEKSMDPSTAINNIERVRTGLAHDNKGLHPSHQKGASSIMEKAAQTLDKAKKFAVVVEEDSCSPFSNNANPRCLKTSAITRCFAWIQGWSVLTFLTTLFGTVMRT